MDKLQNYVNLPMGSADNPSGDPMLRDLRMRIDTWAANPAPSQAETRAVATHLENHIKSGDPNKKDDRKRGVKEQLIKVSDKHLEDLLSVLPKPPRESPLRDIVDTILAERESARAEEKQHLRLVQANNDELRPDRGGAARGPRSDPAPGASPSDPRSVQTDAPQAPTDPAFGKRAQERAGKMEDVLRPFGENKGFSTQTIVELEVIIESANTDGAWARGQAFTAAGKALEKLDIYKLRALLLVVNNGELRDLIRDLMNAKGGVTSGAHGTAVLGGEGVERGEATHFFEVTPKQIADRAKAVLERANKGAALRDGFYGLAKADQVALERQIGQLLLEQAKSGGPASKSSPEQLFQALLGRLTERDRKLYEALRSNDNSRFAVEDEIYASVKGMGTYMPGLIDAFRKRTAAQRAQIEGRYYNRYGERLDDRLYDETSDTFTLTEDYAQVALLRRQQKPGDGELAFRIWQASQSADATGLFTAFEEAVESGRFAHIEALFAEAVPGRELIRDVMDSLRRSGQGSSRDWYARMDALLKGKYDHYLALTAKLVAERGHPPAELVRVFERYKGKVTPEQLRAAYTAEGGKGDLVAEVTKRDAALAILFSDKADGPPQGGDLASLAMALRDTLESSSERGPRVSALLAKVKPEQRDAFLRTFETMHGQSVEQAIAKAFPPSKTGKSQPWRDRLVFEAAGGKHSLVGLLGWVRPGFGTPSELLSALAAAAPDERRTLRSDFDKRHRRGDFDLWMAGLEPRIRRAVQMQLGMTPEEIEKLWFSQRRETGWAGASRFMMDTFGFSGVFLDTAVHDFFIESERITRRIERDGEVSADDLRTYLAAHAAMLERFAAYDREKADVADTVSGAAATIAGITVAIASGGSLSPLVLLASAATTGVVASTATGLVMGSDATFAQLVETGFKAGAVDAIFQGGTAVMIKIAGRTVKLVGGPGPTARIAPPPGAPRELPMVHGVPQSGGAMSPSTFETLRPTYIKEIEGVHPPSAAELSKLSSDEYRAIFGEARPPRSVVALAGFPGFADFARANPSLVQRLVIGADSLGVMNVWSRASGFFEQGGTWADFAAFMDAGLPRIDAAPGLAGYLAVNGEGADLALFPRYQLRPTIAHDHNGAFMLASNAGRSWLPNLRPMRPGDIFVDGAPLASFDGVFVFSGHGSVHGISGMDPRTVARVIADSVEHLPRGSVQNIVLEACSQRDAHLLVGSSSSHRIMEEVRRVFAERGLPPVRVLAAERPGHTFSGGSADYPSMQRASYWPDELSFHSERLAWRLASTRFTPAGTTPYIPFETLARGVRNTGIGVGAVGGVVITYGVVRDRIE
ncbi:MAG: hypothetical protein ACAI38_13010 [Myxococcota bacterium]